MDSELRNKKSRVYNSFKGVLHIAMGVIYIVLGCATIYMKAFLTVEISSAAVAYIIGGLFLLYGAFRLWRGLTDMRRQY